MFYNSLDATEYSWDQPEHPWMYFYFDKERIYKILMNRKERNKVYLRDAFNKIIEFRKFLEDELDVDEYLFREEDITEVISSISKGLRNRSLKGRFVIYDFGAKENCTSITRRDDLMEKEEKNEN